MRLQTPSCTLRTQAGLIVLLTAAYAAAGAISLSAGNLSAHSSFVWLPAGIALAALLLYGAQLAPGIALGAFAAHLIAGSPLLMTVAAALGATVSALAALWLLERRLLFAHGLPRPRDVLCLIGVGAFATPIVAASVEVGAAFALQSIELAALPEAWALRWAADALGVLLVTPLALSWLASPKFPPAQSAVPRIALFALQLAVGGFVFVLDRTPGAGQYIYLTLALVTAMFLPLAWVATANAVAFALAVAGTLLGSGPFGAGDFASLQIYAIASSLATLMLASLAQEREAVATELRDSVERFKQLTSLSSDWYWEQDENLRFVQIAGLAVDEQRLRAQDIVGRTRWDIETADEGGARAAHDEAVAARLPFRDVMTSYNTHSEQRTIAVSGAPIFDGQQRFRGYRGVARDITAQVRAEREIDEAKRFLDALINALPSPMLVKDHEHRYIAVNASFCTLFRSDASAILGKTDYDFFAPADAAFFQTTDDQVLQGDHAVEYERSCAVGRNSPPRWMIVRKSGLTRPDGSRVIMLLLIDVTQRREAEARVRASEERFRSLTHLSSDWYWEQDAQLRFTFVSAHREIDTSVTLAHIIGKTRFELDVDWDSAALREQHSQALLHRQPFKDLLIRDRKSGSYTSVSGEPMFDTAGNFTGYRGVARDVTAEQDARQGLHESEKRFRDFADAAGEYVWETDLEDRFTYVSSRVQTVWGYSDQELIGRRAQELMPAGEAERVAEWLRHHQHADGSFRDLEHMIVNRREEVRWLLINAVSRFDPAGQRIGRRGTGRDITDRRAAEARISYLATRDPLTELPNRVLFNDRLEQGIVLARRTGQSLALLFIDLDRFKNINDSLGHQIGDLLLKEVAVRMQQCIRKGDTVSRLGGDEFVVTLEGLQQAEDASQVASKIIKSLARPFGIGGHTLSTSCSIGISIYPIDADDDRTLMKNADTAMYHAKEKGRNNYQFFSPEMNVRAVERHTLETALRQAVERQQFALYYQPQVDMRSGKVVGMEALLRWQHPERGLLSPGTFISVAEESGLIEPIGQWTLHTACERAKAWVDAGYPAVKIAVNISPRLLAHPKDFTRSVLHILAETGLEPRLLELEMTESLLVDHRDDNIALLRKLGQEGVRIAVDDFGTGYSSLSYLRQLPIDALKIDRSFVRDIETDPEDIAIVQAIVAMAHSLGLQVTAEGVETHGQLAALARLGCDEYQGYLFSRPLPAVEVAARFLAPQQLDFGTPLALPADQAD